MGVLLSCLANSVNSFSVPFHLVASGKHIQNSTPLSTETGEPTIRITLTLDKLPFSVVLIIHTILDRLIRLFDGDLGNIEHVIAFGHTSRILNHMSVVYQLVSFYPTAGQW